MKVMNIKDTYYIDYSMHVFAYIQYNVNQWNLNFRFFLFKFERELMNKFKNQA